MSVSIYSRDLTNTYQFLIECWSLQTWALTYIHLLNIDLIQRKEAPVKTRPSQHHIRNHKSSIASGILDVFRSSKYPHLTFRCRPEVWEVQIQESSILTRTTQKPWDVCLCMYLFTFDYDGRDEVSISLAGGRNWVSKSIYNLPAVSELRLLSPLTLYEAQYVEPFNILQT